MKLLLALLAVFGCMLVAPLASADSLNGTQVTLTGDLPTLGTAFTNSVTRTIGPGLEFPSGTLVSTAGGVAVIGVNIDVGASDIDFSYTQNSQALSATFNGYVFDFSGATITGASLDPSSDYNSGQIGVGFGPNEVTVNAEGVFFTAGSHILVDLSAVTSPVMSNVPEPQSYAMLLTGLTALGWCIGRRRLHVGRT
ncbi:MAG TPA: PEP-CTERM sorting domain-containing protein [Bryobacteraceae bacterium]